MTEVSMSFVTRPVESAATFLCLEVQLGLRVAENEPDSVSVMKKWSGEKPERSWKLTSLRIDKNFFCRSIFFLLIVLVIHELLAIT